MATSDQVTVLRLALDLLDVVQGRAPAPDELAADATELTVEQFAAAGLATGLTAAIGSWAERGGVTLPPPWDPWIADQRGEVASRQRRFDEVTWRVLTALADADVAAVPVKGVVLARTTWPGRESRPMADIDLLVDAARRDEAAAALVDAGFDQIDRNPWEDTFLAWPGEEPLRMDGESVGHPGKIELHPGWVERLHNYLVADDGTLTGRAAPGELAGGACHRLDPPGFAAHVVGHLSAAVVRADVRALNVVDTIVSLRALADDEHADYVELTRRLDPRLSAPGLWLAASFRPDDVGAHLLATTLARLPRPAAELLAGTRPADVLRDASRRTPWAWRAAFTTTATERVRMARQFLWPSRSDLRGGHPDGDTAMALTRARLGRVARRALAR